MSERQKIAIAGAGSLRGKELNDTLTDSVFAAAEVRLLDDGDALGQLETTGDEITFVQQLEAGSFAGMDYVFFAGSEATTLKYWDAAVNAGASVVDLSGALAGTPGVPVRAPWVEEADGVLGLQTHAVVAAHAAALVLALLLDALQKAAAVRTASATVLGPASEFGAAAVDELHQQTVGLLNFQSLPREVFGMQTAFNLLPSFGSEATASLAATEQAIRSHYETLAGNRLPGIVVQLIEAPVFHGYGISLAVELDTSATLPALREALGGAHVEVTAGDDETPTNLSSAGQDKVLVRLRGEGTRYWLWATADNLKLAALNAVACAMELGRLRPRGKVQ